MAGTLVRVLPLHYLHILDVNTNVVSLECGPENIALQTNQQVVQEPTPMILIPPLHYCMIINPVQLDTEGSPVKQQFYDEDGTVKEIYKIRFGVKEIRTNETHPKPFPLYPYEKLSGKVERLIQVPVQEALRLKALADFKDQTGKSYNAGEEWILKGPCMYIPHVDVQLVQNIKAQIILHNTALKVKAIRDCIDADGIQRKAGEKWLIRSEGAYIPQVDEQILKLRKAIIISQKEALHLRARVTFTDIYGIKRKAGDEWLITRDISEQHIQDVNEKIIDRPQAITLTSRQYCYILDPYDPKTQTNKYGQKEVKKGECTFFLQPKESIENEEILFSFVMSPDEALLLQADKPYKDGEKVYQPGDKWMIRGPGEYTPPVEVNVLETRKLIQLAEKEGIYVRDMKTGQVRAVIGRSYMLDTHEVLWEKQLYMEIEWLLGFRIKQTNLIEGLKNISGVDAKAVEQQIRQKVEEAPTKIAAKIQKHQEKEKKVIPKASAPISSTSSLQKQIKPQAEQSQKQQQARKKKAFKHVKQERMKAPTRNVVCDVRKRESQEVESMSSSDDENDAMDIKLDLEENIMEKLQVFNKAQQVMNVQNQEAELQNLLLEENFVQKDEEEKSEPEIPTSYAPQQFQGFQAQYVQPAFNSNMAPQVQQFGGFQAQYVQSAFNSNMAPQVQQFGGFQAMPQQQSYSSQQWAPSAGFVPQQQLQQQVLSSLNVAPQRQDSVRGGRGRGGRGRGSSAETKKRSAFKGFQTSNISEEQEEEVPYQQDSRYMPAPEEQQKITFKQFARPWDDTISLRDKTKIIQFRAPHNSAVQIYNFKSKETRIEFGPELVMLEPEEILVLNRLSGGLPKRENAIALLYIPLGPDFMMDIVEIETSDHARLNLSVKYNWKFDVKDKEDAQNIFKIKDFVGYACRAIASRIRGFTSKYRFEEFHKNSAELIKQAVFSRQGQMLNELRFESNQLVIFGIDVQYVEPIDKKTREGLSQSVSMAIEITTQMTKADAEHIAAKQEQQWTGLLARQKIQDQVEAEKSRKRLLELQAESEAVQSTGLAIAVAKARAETQKIDGQAAVEKAKLKAQSETILQENDLELDAMIKEQEINHKRKLYEQEILKARQLMEIELTKFEKQIKAIGSETLVSMAKAGPEQQAKLLKGLGLKGFMMMDGKHPVNLFNTAMGMVKGAVQ